VIFFYQRAGEPVYWTLVQCDGSPVRRNAHSRQGKLRQKSKVEIMMRRFHATVRHRTWQNQVVLEKQHAARWRSEKNAG
jgi:hypothetical protein